MGRKSNFNMTNIIIILIILGVITIAGTQYSIKYAQSEVELVKFARPQYGTIRCASSDITAKTDPVSLPRGEFTFKCPSETFDQCQVYGRMTKYIAGIWGGCDDHIFYNYNGEKKDGRELWYVLRSTSSCDKNNIEKGTWFNLGRPLKRTEYMKVSVNDEKNPPPSIDSRDEFLPAGRAEIYATYVPSQLEIKRADGKLVLIKQEYGCDLTKAKEQGISDIVLEVNGEKTECNLDACVPGGVTNWVEYWDYGLIEQGEFVTYNNEQYICLVGNPTCLYSIGEIKTTDGTYKYADKCKVKVECCPGQQYGNLICDKETLTFKPKKVEEIECRSDDECGGTSYQLNPEDPSKACIWKCVNGKCQETSNCIKPECVTDSDCASGHCSDDFKCIGQTLPPFEPGFECPAGQVLVKETQEYCNNMWCHLGLADKVISEKTFCLAPSESGELDLLLAIIVIALIIGGGILILRKKSRPEEPLIF